MEGDLCGACGLPVVRCECPPERAHITEEEQRADVSPVGEQLAAEIERWLTVDQ